MPARLSSIHLFPIKSCAALTLDVATVEARGLVGDRRWMVVDAAGRFVTGRQQPRLTQVRAVPEGDTWALVAPGAPASRLHVPATAERIDTAVWGTPVRPLVASAEANAWISTVLGVSAQWVYMDDACRRAVDVDYASAGDIVSFADGFPLLLISQAALDALNAKLARPVPMLRFRPNLVVADTEAHAEDGWKRIRVGEVEFDVVKPCTRCVFTTVDIERGEFDPSGEPLRTLLGYRRGREGVTFGQNLIPRSLGRVRLGDAVDVLE
jgi:uncharacterized protein YcbX